MKGIHDTRAKFEFYSSKMSETWKIICIALHCFIHLVCCQFNESDLGDGKLIFAHTLCRHGDRNIYGTYPNDPWGSTEFWPGGYGALTNIGKRDHYVLGQYLRERYAALLGNGDYSPSRVYIRSTDTERTLMSAEASMAGLFPPSANKIWNEELNWQPIPIHTTSAHRDYILATQKKCDRFDYEMGKFINGSTYQTMFERFKPHINYVAENGKFEIKTILRILVFYDTLTVEKLKGKRLSEWAERMLADEDLRILSKFWFEMHTTNNAMKKLKAGFLLKEIFERFMNKSQSTLKPDRTLWMYFAHDITMTNVLNSLGISGLFKKDFLPYSCCLFFELYKTNDMAHVKLLYKNPKQANVLPLTFPDCDEKCPLDKLFKLYNDILPTQSFEEECALRDGETLPPGGNPETYSLEAK